MWLLLEAVVCLEVLVPLLYHCVPSILSAKLPLKFRSTKLYCMLSSTFSFPSYPYYQQISFVYFSMSFLIMAIICLVVLS